MNNQRVAVVAGANGVAGNKLIEELVETGWQVIGLSRRGGKDRPGVRYLSVDLHDKAATLALLKPLEVTHLFYTAYQHADSWAGLVEPNLRMLDNVLTAAENASRLEHVSLMQGYKVYGAHLGPFKTPARESDEGHMPPEFNVAQQALIEDRQAGKNWHWTALRPSVVGGISTGNPMNLALSLAVYASLCKELHLPFRFPGKPGAWTSLIEMTDAGMLAKATVWAATGTAAKNQAFNVNNGDLFRWQEMWPKIAAWFDLAVAPPLPMSLKEVMSDKAALWQDIASKHSLQENRIGQLAGWEFVDFVLGWDYDMFADGSKLRRAGFHHYCETEQMFYRLFTQFRQLRLIP
ncbi:SDR family oxidoreductase [Erwinia sp. 9145]|uniref:SDR family oxidoreductase n=1 Tax=Erwinia sp. 9145 TaxID=1500895 RepID=UPI0005566FDA|nr:SDR family oxidoreductase [Erwinia sp. 9145]